MVTRRFFVMLGMAGTTSLVAPSLRAAGSSKGTLNRSDAEWRKQLSPEQYAVLREGGTEMPFTSPLLHEKRAGTFICAGCDLALFSSTTKFDSGTGWPSFWSAIKGAVGTSVDRSFGAVRTEAHCSRCGGHLGHIFDDGPKPTGLRYCIDGVAMAFTPSVG
ncbi:peptide-methionine (R)-S-oxide reductase MsrB [Microvirga antarctica]|uniref:peptide-methionine (R)-S-oxide reductase MsrB n=1 Tax=Microvirga antarctica TaxID=2819233 RepID=UPI001B3084BE|nr:peptide-methionine (R)-S-oxide reductase MsrB [Microvirga antarctica]